MHCKERREKKKSLIAKDENFPSRPTCFEEAFPSSLAADWWEPALAAIEQAGSFSYFRGALVQATLLLRAAVCFNASH